MSGHLQSDPSRHAPNHGGCCGQYRWGSAELLDFKSVTFCERCSRLAPDRESDVLKFARAC